MRSRQQEHAPQMRVDLYEVSMDIFFHEDKKVINRVQNYGEIKEERYTWGRDNKNRPRREHLTLSVIVPRVILREFKIALSQLDNYHASKIGYRKVSTLI